MSGLRNWSIPRPPGFRRRRGRSQPEAISRPPICRGRAMAAGDG